MYGLFEMLFQQTKVEMFGHNAQNQTTYQHKHLIATVNMVVED